MFLMSQKVEHLKPSSTIKHGAHKYFIELLSGCISESWVASWIKNRYLLIGGRI